MTIANDVDYGSGSENDDARDSNSCPINRSKRDSDLDSSTVDDPGYDEDSGDWIMGELQRQIDEQLQAELDVQFDQHLSEELDHQLQKQLDDDLQRELDEQYEAMLVSAGLQRGLPEEAFIFGESEINSTGATVANINAQIGQIAKRYENCYLEDQSD